MCNWNALIFGENQTDLIANIFPQTQPIIYES